MSFREGEKRGTFVAWSRKKRKTVRLTLGRERAEGKRGEGRKERLPGPKERKIWSLGGNGKKKARIQGEKIPKAFVSASRNQRVFQRKKESPQRHKGKTESPHAHASERTEVAGILARGEKSSLIQLRRAKAARKKLPGVPAQKRLCVPNSTRKRLLAFIKREKTPEGHIYPQRRGGSRNPVRPNQGLGLRAALSARRGEGKEKASFCQETKGGGRHRPEKK